MTDWLLVLTVLSVAAILSCFRFVGCFLDSVGQAGPPAPPSDYGVVVGGEPDLIAYWRLGEPVGTSVGDTAQDEKGSNPGIYQTTDLVAGPQSPETLHPPFLAAGQPGLLATAPTQTSVSVNGGYVRVPFSDAINFSATPGFSVEVWVRPEWGADETDVFRCVVASREDTGLEKYGYILYAGPILDPVTFQTTDPAMYWQAWVGDGKTWLMLVGPPVGLDLDTYLLATYDAATQTLTLEVRNANTDTATYTPSIRPMTTYSPNPAAGAKPLYIGMGAPELATPRYPFLGRIQEVALYGNVLPADHASQHLEAAQGS